MTIATIVGITADVLPGLIGISAVLVAAAAVLSLALHIRRAEHDDAGGWLAVVCLAVVVLLVLARIITAELLPNAADDGLAATNLPLIAAAALSIIAAAVVVADPHPAGPRPAPPMTAASPTSPGHVPPVRSRALRLGLWSPPAGRRSVESMETLAARFALVDQLAERLHALATKAASTVMYGLVILASVLVGSDIARHATVTGLDPAAAAITIAAVSLGVKALITGLAALIRLPSRR